MFSSTIQKLHLAGNQRGYSLIELVASLVLLAAIAALSLPTYQDFSPHADAAGQTVHPRSNEGELTAGSTQGEVNRQNQPVEGQPEQPTDGSTAVGEKGEATREQSREA